MPELEQLHGPMKFYISTLDGCLRHAKKVVAAVALVFICSFVAYAKFGAGVEFFPQVDADFMQVQIQARGDLSLEEKDLLVKNVERQLDGMKDIRIIYAKTLNEGTKVRKAPNDTIGIIQLELNDWRFRAKQSVILSELRNRASSVAGIKVQIRQKEQGPKSTKPIELQLRSYDLATLHQSTNIVRHILDSTQGLTDIEDTSPLPGIEWQVNINREEAARFGINVLSLGAVIRLVSNGLKITDYQPNDTDEEVDIRLRFPSNYRHLEQLQQLRIPTAKGAVPMSNFIEFTPAPKVSEISHSNGIPSINLSADVKPGVLADQKIQEITQALKQAHIPEDVQIEFKGDQESQQETKAFLGNAFLIALFLMFIILLVQFNRFSQVFIVLSAVVLSTTGVFIGLLLMAQPFSIVMCGLGVIALAGVVVNNNIILIDTFNENIKQGLSIRDAILSTAYHRLRPVLLTSVTTVLGLLPMVFSMTIDLIGRDVSIGAPSTQWWVQLSSSIAGGLTFATILTLILTPCLLFTTSNKANIKADCPKHAIL